MTAPAIPLTGRVLFAATAPRLERAHRERILELQEERFARHRARVNLQKAERLVAHRELQVLRAASRRRGRNIQGYVDWRHEKLARARVALVVAQAHAVRIGALS